MQRLYRLAGLSAAIAWWMGSAHADTHRIHVAAGKTPLRHTPVSMPLPEQLADRDLRLATPEGRFIPSQVDRTGRPPRLVWIIDGLAAGSSATYVLSAQAASTSSETEGVALLPKDHGLDILVDGKLFTSYQTKAGPKPYFWPIIGPTGKPITRAYPMKTDVPGERKDHPHHRSLWFTHGKVNRNDFWSEAPTASKTVHREFTSLRSGPVFGEMIAKVDWIARSGRKVCEDTRRLRVYRVPDARLCDFEIAIDARQGELLFGDDKEGTFGLRVASSMDVKQPAGTAHGRILNSRGDTDVAAWGKRAEWCDYTGPVDGETVGIAIFDHPKNLRHPTYWHVRDYGLFCANPFGVSFFTGDKRADGSHRVEAGGTLRLQYRLYLHRGDAASARVADHYAAFAEPPTIRLE